MSQFTKKPLRDKVRKMVWTCETLAKDSSNEEQIYNLDWLEWRRESLNF